MKSVKLTVRRGRTQKDGRVSVNLVYACSRTSRTEISTGVLIEPEYWVPLKEEIKKSAPNSEFLNKELFAQKLKLESIIQGLRQSGLDDSPEYVKSLFLGKSKETHEQNNFMEVLNTWIIRSKSRVSYNTTKDHLALRKYLTEFEKYRKRKITFKQIDYGFYEDFVDFLENVTVKRNGKVGLVKSSVGKVIKNLKIFLRNSMRRKFCPEIDLEGFKVFQETGDHIYLDEAEIDLIANLDFSSNEKLDKVRDMLIVGCETGLRFSDFSNLNKNAIIRPVIKTKTRKTMTPVVIPISKRLDKILLKYDDNLPRIKNRDEFNKMMKTVVKEAGITEMVQKMHLQGNKKIEEWVPKYALVSSHTCRRSFCTNSFLKGLPTLVIRGISGHADDKNLFRYIKVSPVEAVEATLNRIKDLPEFRDYFVASNSHNKSALSIGR